jgi:hypothetical protein
MQRSLQGLFCGLIDQRGRSFQTSDVCRDCLDTRKAIQT